MISYNVENVWWYNGTPGDRDNAVASKLLAQDPDFICLQEFDPLYRTPSDGSDSLIKLISEQYTEVSIDGMEDRKDEIYNPIFYDHSEYIQKASGYVWFMDVIAVVDDAGNPLSALTKEYKYPGYPKDYEGIKEVLPNSFAVHGRSGASKRQAGEIGIHALRMGNVVGEHQVIVSTNNQTITLKHEAHNRALFAEGAIVAGDFLLKQGAGLYGMKDLLKD